MKTLSHRNTQIRYELRGQAGKPAIVFLHGYLESLDIWMNFLPLLEDNFHILSIDLPGHGKSGTISTTHTMEELAEAVRDVMLSRNIRKVHMVGHSMGGYVALAFADLYVEYLSSCVLFHSSCFADTEEKRANRNREIDLVREGKMNVLVNTNIPMAFADNNLEEFSEEVERAKSIAADTDEEGVIANLNGMKSRPDRCHLFQKGNISYLLIAGKKDNYIPFDVAQNMADSGKDLELAVLEDSGHMGFIEEREKAAWILREFFMEKT